MQHIQLLYHVTKLYATDMIIYTVDRNVEVIIAEVDDVLFSLTLASMMKWYMQNISYVRRTQMPSKDLKNVRVGMTNYFCAHERVLRCEAEYHKHRSSSHVTARTVHRAHDDVIKWKHFPRNWPFVRGIQRSLWSPHTKASDAELWCFLCSAFE